MNRYVIGLLILGIGLTLLLFQSASGVNVVGEEDRFGGLVRLVALGAVLGLGFANRRSLMDGSVLGSAAVWLGFFLLLMVGYQNRHELQDFGSRISLGLIPASPLSISDADGRATVVVEKQMNGHFDVRGSIEGHAVNFMVDTGATTTVLTWQDAERAGLDLASLKFIAPVSTANGETTAARLRIKEIRVGDIVRRNQSVMVARNGAMEQSLLGMSFISSLSGFDMRGDRLTFRD